MAPHNHPFLTQEATVAALEKGIFWDKFLLYNHLLQIALPSQNTPKMPQI